MQKTYPCIWFDNQAEEAAKFYTSVFKNSKMGTVALYPEGSPGPAGTVMTTEFDIEGFHMMGLNGGPIFKINPAISFYVQCPTIEEVDELWKKLSDGGKVLMEIGEYPYSKRYGWLQDKYGVTWQLIHTEEKILQKICPSFLFANQKFGQAGEAIDFYTSIFPDSKIISMTKATGAPYKEGMVMFCMFTLCGQRFVAMDGPGEHAFDFNEAISIVVDCENQKELDGYWDAMSAVKESEQCGWIKDKFGVSWQINAKRLNELMTSQDKAQVERVMHAMLQMKKLDIAELEKAAKEA